MIRWVLLLVVVLVVLRILRPLRRRPPAIAWDPWAVLGVPRDASPEDVTRAYREQLKRYHPDRVADLGPELQRVAHQKTLDIQRAYRELAGTRP